LIRSVPLGGFSTDRGRLHRKRYCGVPFPLDKLLVAVWLRENGLEKSLACGGEKVLKMSKYKI
jgi:hypothetical protein